MNADSVNQQPIVAFAFLPIPNRPHARSFAFSCVMHSSSLAITLAQYRISSNTSRALNISRASNTGRRSDVRKGKERSVFIQRLYCSNYTQSAQAWITQFYLQITPRLPFLLERSPDVATTATAAADIQLQLTSCTRGRALNTSRASNISRGSWFTQARLPVSTYH